MHVVRVVGVVVVVGGVVYLDVYVVVLVVLGLWWKIVGGGVVAVCNISGVVVENVEHRSHGIQQSMAQTWLKDKPNMDSQSRHSLCGVSDSG